MTAALAKIRKALLAGGGALAAGAGGVLTADQMNLSLVTQAQVSTVLLLSLAAAVGTFAVPNADAAPVVVPAAADETVAQALAVLQDELSAALAPITGADLYGGHAATPPASAGVRVG